jgi:hypothetical protein
MESQMPGIPNAELMARMILNKREGAIDPLDYERAFGMPYSQVWNPFSGSPLYSTGTGRQERWARFRRDVLDSKRVLGSLRKRFDEQDIAVRRWGLALAIHGDGLLLAAGSAERKTVSEGDRQAGLMRHRVEAAVARVYARGWSEAGEFKCGEPPVDWSEVTQGQLLDCSLIATVASLLRLELFPEPEHRADGVRVQIGARVMTVGRAVRYSPESGDPLDARGRRCGTLSEVWPSCVEYAYAAYRGAQSRDDLGLIERLFPCQTLHDLTGMPVTTVTVLIDIDWGRFLDAEGRFIRPAVAWTAASRAHVTENIASHHSYSVVGGLRGAHGRVTDLVLRNPAGTTDRRDEVLDHAFKRLEDSEVWRGFLGKPKHGLIAIPVERFAGWFAGLSYV